VFDLTGGNSDGFADHATDSCICQPGAACPLKYSPRIAKMAMIKTCFKTSFVTRHDFAACGKTYPKNREISEHGFSRAEGFVSGHDFSRAEEAKRIEGFSP